MTEKAEGIILFYKLFVSFQHFPQKLNNLLLKRIIFLSNLKLDLRWLNRILAMKNIEIRIYKILTDPDIFFSSHWKEVIFEFWELCLIEMIEKQERLIKQQKKKSISVTLYWQLGSHVDSAKEWIRPIFSFNLESKVILIIDQKRD